MEDDHKKKQETVDLLEDGWFFGNFLNRKAKMVRCNSDPTPSSMTKKEDMFGPKKNGAESSNLLRTPSLPPKLGKEEQVWGDEDDEDYGPRMGDLIRQAMPKLAKTPSLPPFRIKKEVLSNESVALTPKGPTMSKLTRRCSLDTHTSILLPPKHNSNSKGMKQNLSAPSTSKNLQQKRTEMLHRNVESIRGSKSRSLERSMSLKILRDKEVQGFQDLGFKFNKKKDLCSSVIKEEPNEEGEEVDVKLQKSPSLSEAWNTTQQRSNSSPPIPKWSDSKSSAEDMKAQIKFWARAVASNVRQEC